MSQKARENGSGEKVPVGDHYGLDLRLKYQGLIGVSGKVPIKDAAALSLLYTPGVAAPCLEIARSPIRSFDLTCRGNTVALISDGSSLRSTGSGVRAPSQPWPCLRADRFFSRLLPGWMLCLLLLTPRIPKKS